MPLDGPTATKFSMVTKLGKGQLFTGYTVGGRTTERSYHLTQTNVEVRSVCSS